MLLDELIIKLGLEDGGLVSKGGPAVKKLGDIEKAGRGAESSVKGIGAASKETSASLSGLTEKLGSFLALIGGTYALKTFISDAVNTNTQLSFLSRNLGTSAQAIFAWSTASQELGGTAGGLQNTLRMLSQEGANLAFLGQSRLIPFFARMRIALPNPQDPNGPVIALRQMAEYAERAMKLGATRTTMHNWFAEFIPDEGTINLILQGTAALDAAQTRAKKWAPTDAELSTAVRMKAALADLEAQFLKVGYDMLQVAAPALEKFFGWLQQIGTWIGQHPVLADIFVGAALAAAALGTAIAGATVVAGAFGAAMAAIGISASPILALAAAFTAVAAALGIASGLAPDMGFTSREGGIKRRPWPGARSGIGIQALEGAIAKQEGFGKKGTIPTKANNPGAIEYGDFARKHGATGSIMAAEGKQIAMFPDAATGWAALYELLQNNYSDMSFDAAIAKYTGLKGSQLSAYQTGVAQSLSRHMNAAAAPGARQWNGTGASQGNRTLNIASMVINTMATDAKGIFEDVKRGTDWLKWGAPANGASQ